MLSLNIFKAFLSGSCIIVFLPFFITFKSLENYLNLKKNRFVDAYYKYSIICPLYFGICSVIAYLISYYGKLDLHLTFLIISILATILTSIFVTYQKIYNFSQKSWHQYYLFLFIYYFIAFNVIIVNILKILLS